MDWVSLGMIQASYDWQWFSIPVYQVETFKVTQTYIETAIGTALIAQGWGVPPKIYEPLRLFPRKDDQIYQLRIPDEFWAIGELTRYIGIKTNWQTYLGENGWQVSVSYLDLPPQVLNQINQTQSGGSSLPIKNIII